MLHAMCYTYMRPYLPKSDVVAARRSGWGFQLFVSLCISVCVSVCPCSERKMA